MLRISLRSPEQAYQSLDSAEIRRRALQDFDTTLLPSEPPQYGKEPWVACHYTSASYYLIYWLFHGSWHPLAHWWKEYARMRDENNGSSEHLGIREFEVFYRWEETIRRWLMVGVVPEEDLDRLIVEFMKTQTRSMYPMIILDERGWVAPIPLTNIERSYRDKGLPTGFFKAHDRKNEPYKRSWADKYVKNDDRYSKEELLERQSIVQQALQYRGTAQDKMLAALLICNPHKSTIETKKVTNERRIVRQYVKHYEFWALKRLEEYVKRNRDTYENWDELMDC